MSFGATLTVNRVGEIPSRSNRYAVGSVGSTDDDLLRATATGDRLAYEELVRRFQAPVFRFLNRMLNAPDDAEEAMLDVFVRVWQHAPRFQFRSKVSTWIYRIAVNIARDAHSRKKSRPQEPWPNEDVLASMAVGSAESDALDRLELQRKSESLHKALDKLHESDRMLLVLYYLQDCEYDEIQEITGLSYTVLKTRLARARRRLRDLMEGELSEA